MFKTFATAALAASAVSLAHAEIIATALDGVDTNLTAFVNDAPAFSSAGDIFGEVVAGVDGMPFALADDSVTDVSGAGAGLPFETDDDGIVDTADFNAGNDVFGVVDNVNNDNPDGVSSATWTFDITSAIALTDVTIDFAAQGDFEPSDVFTVTASIDGGLAVTLFSSSVDEDGVQSYTVDSGLTTDFDDPLFINGVVLDNEFLTLSADLVGAGSTLDITLTAEADGGSEAFAIDNIIVNGVIPEPASVALLAAGLAAVGLRRRGA
jgi:hypothetical protein